MSFLLLAAALIVQAPPAASSPPSRSLAMAERLSRAGMLASIVGVAGGGEARSVVDSHPELTPEQRARAQAAADRAVSEATSELMRAEARAFAALLTPEQIKAATIFFESRAGLAYRAAFPKVVAGVSQAGPAKDFKGYITQRVCAETQVCPPRK